MKIGYLGIVENTNKDPEGIGYYYNDNGEKIISETDIIIPSSVNGIQVTDVGPGMFASAKSLKSIVIPEGVTTIRFGAFHNCTGLEDVILPSTLKTIEQSGFNNCSSLKNITLPDGLENIEGHAFAWSGLEEITIPGTVTSLIDPVPRGKYYPYSNSSSEQWREYDYGAFSCCSDLKRVYISEGVEVIGYCAFCNCDQLQEVHFPSTLRLAGVKGNQDWGLSIVFESCDGFITMYLKEGTPITLQGVGSFNISRKANIIYY